MKSELVFLTFLAASLAAPSPDPQHFSSWSQGIDRSYGPTDPQYAGQGSWGAWGQSLGSKEADRRIEGNEKRQGDVRREDKRREEERTRENERREEERKREWENKNYEERNKGIRRDDSEFPWIIGRQGLGYQKRNYRSLAMRFPITPEILEPQGYRDTIKDLIFVPLNQFS